MVRALDEVSAMPLQYPQGFFAPAMQEAVTNGTTLRPVW